MPPERLQGRTRVAQVLGVTPPYVRALSALCVDPLPLRILGGRVWVLDRYLREWDERRRDLRRVRRGARPQLPVLVGRAAVARRAGVSTREVDRWSGLADDPLPMRGRAGRERLPGGELWIYETALRDWLQRRDRPYLGGRRGR